MESPPLAVYVRKRKRSTADDHEHPPPSSSTSKCSTPTKACLKKKKNPISAASAVGEVDNRDSHYCPTSSQFQPVTPVRKQRKKLDVPKVVSNFFKEQNINQQDNRGQKKQQAERPATHVFSRPRACHIKRRTNIKYAREEAPSSAKSRGPLQNGRSNRKGKAKICKLLMECDPINHSGAEASKEKWWEEHQRIYQKLVGLFISRMHCIQGDRSFTLWKGSVVDSVIGAFLTQNVSDSLSSSAFISLAARFPLHLTRDNRARDKEEIKTFVDETEVSIENMSIKTRSGRARTDLKTTEGKGSRSGSNSAAKDLMSRCQSHNPDKGFSETTTMDTSKVNKIKVEKAKVKKLKGKKAKVNPGKVRKADFGHWERLRKEAVYGKATKEERSKDMEASLLHHEALRCAKVGEIADAIMGRGQHNNLAERIKDFLNQTVKNHGSIDLEWLRDIPPDEAKEYLMSIYGLGLKSVECIRLLTLHQAAFPVDTNVGRIAVRLGWVPVQPRSEDDLLHRLESYPQQKSIQEYLWPLLCKLDPGTLYELHYQMITFGKVFCTKKNPNCNACPMSEECKHYASELASKRPTLPGTGKKAVVTPMLPIVAYQHPDGETNLVMETRSGTIGCEPIIEEPATPKNRCMEISVPDIEDAFYEEEPGEIPTVSLNFEKLLPDDDMSKALVTITPEAASIPTRKLKNVTRLRTEHCVYELPYGHRLLDALDERLPDDPCPYLLAIWAPGETEESTQPSERCRSLKESGKLRKEGRCLSRSSIRKKNSETVPGTLLLPVKTTMRGSFPLNGTYFQVNEVFADHESSLCPIPVPRDWIWNLPRRIVYFGTSVTSIYRGLSKKDIRRSFHKEYICVRGFDTKTRAPRPLDSVFHASNNQKVQKQRVSGD